MGNELAEILRELSRPFPWSQVGAKPVVKSQDGSKVLAVAYVEARAVIDRLNSLVVWEDDYWLLQNPSDDVAEGQERLWAVECRLTIHPPAGDGGRAVTRKDVGEGATLKAAYSDALKRAAVKFGVGLYLYDLPQVWVPAKNGFITPEGREKAIQTWKQYLGDV